MALSQNAHSQQIYFENKIKVISGETVKCNKDRQRELVTRRELFQSEEALNLKVCLPISIYVFIYILGRKENVISVAEAVCWPIWN